MLGCLGLTLLAMAMLPVAVCDWGEWHACPTFSTHRSAVVLALGGVGLALLAADKTVHKALHAIACLPCTTCAACCKCIRGNKQ